MIAAGDRRDHSLPSRSGNYFGTFRRMPIGDYRLFPGRSDYGGRGGGAAAVGDEYDMYPSNGRHTRDYYSYTREHRYVQLSFSTLLRIKILDFSFAQC